MITGQVNDYGEAVIPIQMRDSDLTLEVVIDTGFQGADLLLPRSVISQAGLVPSGRLTFRLANEQEAQFIYYDGEVMWHGGFKKVRILESDYSYLASADLLAGSRVCIDMTPGGTVTIDEIPAS